MGRIGVIKTIALVAPGISVGLIQELCKYFSDSLIFHQVKTKKITDPSFVHLHRIPVLN